MAHVTDYDVWHESEEAVTVEMVVRVLQKNTSIAQAVVGHLAKTMDSWAGKFAAHDALKDALFTAPDLVPEQTKENLKLLVGKYGY